MKTVLVALAALGLTAAAAPAANQPASPPPRGMAMGQMDHGRMAMNDYMQAMQPMHQAMMRANDADPDRAFAFKMIEHHRGGIAMADVLMKHGDDAELKRMAETMKQEQQKDIADLQGWLDRHGGRTQRP